MKTLQSNTVSTEEIQNTLDELHKSFASLSQEEQKYANIFLHDIQSGNVTLESGKTLRDYITEYVYNAKNDQIHKVAIALGLDENKLRVMLTLGLKEKNINEYGRFDELKATVNKTKAKAYFEELEGKSLPLFKVNIKAHDLLQRFIIQDTIEL